MSLLTHKAILGDIAGKRMALLTRKAILGDIAEIGRVASGVIGEPDQFVYRVVQRN